MTDTTLRRRRRRRWALIAPGLLLLVGGVITGCDDPLAVDDPTAITESDVNTAEGAELLRRGVLRELFGVAGTGAWESGLLADEFLFQQAAFWDAATFPHTELDLLDRRASAADQAQLSAGQIYTDYGDWQSLRGRTAPVAIEKLRAYARPGEREAHVGEMFAVRAYAAMRLAEDYCAGFPMHEVENFKQVYGSPLSTQQALEYALANYDSALTSAADSARVLDFARAGRARTLLQLGRFAEAAATAATVPTNYSYRTENDMSNAANILSSEPVSFLSWGTERSVADREGGNGLDFVSANDPRVALIQRGTARDGTTLFYVIGKYPTRATPIVLAGGLEARLIEAEVALYNGDPSWLTLLNDLRATQISPALGPLADPGTAAARLDLLFRERAFWLFATGTRLADLRRLIQVYGRASESVFPTGSYWRGGSYGPITAIPFAREERDFGAQGCTGV